MGVVPTLYYAFTYKALPILFGIRLMVAGIVFVLSTFKVLAAYWL